MSRGARARLRAAKAIPDAAERIAQFALAYEQGSTQPFRLQNLSVTLARMSTSLPLGVVFELSDDEDSELVDIDHSEPEQALSNAQRRASLLRMIRALPPEEGELVRRHYFDDERLYVIAKSLKISESWASRLQKQAIERLRGRMRRRGSEG